jgi:hypothetical protein
MFLVIAAGFGASHAADAPAPGSGSAPPAPDSQISGAHIASLLAEMGHQHQDFANGYLKLAKLRQSFRIVDPDLDSFDALVSVDGPVNEDQKKKDQKDGAQQYIETKSQFLMCKQACEKKIDSFGVEFVAAARFGKIPGKTIQEQIARQEARATATRDAVQTARKKAAKFREDAGIADSDPEGTTALLASKDGPLAVESYITLKAEYVLQKMELQRLQRTIDSMREALKALK